MALAAVSVAICYADRSNISTAIIPMAEQFQWDTRWQGIILSMFFLGYLATQLLGGEQGEARVVPACLRVSVHVRVRAAQLSWS